MSTDREKPAEDSKASTRGGITFSGPSRRTSASGAVALHGMRLRIALPFVLTTLIAMIVLAIVLGNYARSSYVERLEIELRIQATILGDDVGRPMLQGAPTSEVASIVAGLRPTIASRMTIIDPQGVVIADSNVDPATMENHGSRPEVIEARATGFGESERISATIDDGLLYVAVPIVQVPGAVARVAVSLDDLNEVIWRLRLTFLIAGFVVAAIAGALSLIMAGRIVRPLDDLRTHSLAVAAGDLRTRVVPDSTREIGDLGRSFNAMTSELQRSVETIERAGTRLEAVLASLEDGVIITDDDGHVLRLNRAAEQMLGTTNAAARGRPFVQVSRDHELARHLQDALEERNRASATIEHGLDRMTLLATSQVVSGPRERLGLVVLRDVTRLRQLELVRRDFVANVSHELRTPLTSIRALAETLESGALDDRDLANDFISRILGEVDRLTALVEDLLDMARLEAGRAPLQLEFVDPGELIQHGADRLRPQVERARLSLVVELGEGLVPVPVDRTRIEQVLLNLVHNAIKFTPPGGRIVIRVERDGRFVTTTVRDTGVGIPPEEQDRLFERFYKSDKARHTGGTGLGLAIAKHIVHMHEGQITVHSVPGEGASFRFTLPIKASGSGRTSLLFLPPESI